MTREALTLIWQIGTVLAGLYLMVRYCLQERKAPAAPEQMPLPLWDIEAYAFGFAALRVVVITILFQFMVAAILRSGWPQLDQSQGTGLLLLGASSQVGMLVGLGVALFFMPRPMPPAPWDPVPTNQPRLAKGKILGAALNTFLVTTALVSIVTESWQRGLEFLGVQVPEQEMVELLKSSQSLLEPTIVLFLACVFAPLTEEALFRAGVFRYFRGRAPRWVTFVMPAVLFSLVHFSTHALPGLVLLAVIFSIAYERTGRIAVPMIAHALFNLQTLVITMLDRNGP